MCRGRESSSSVANKGKSGNWHQFSPALVNKTGLRQPAGSVDGNFLQRLSAYVVLARVHDRSLGIQDIGEPEVPARHGDNIAVRRPPEIRQFFTVAVEGSPL